MYMCIYIYIYIYYVCLIWPAATLAWLSPPARELIITIMIIIINNSKHDTNNHNNTNNHSNHNYPNKSHINNTRSGLSHAKLRS